MSRLGVHESTPRTRFPPRVHTQWLIPCIAAGVLTEVCLICIDALFRHDGHGVAFWGGALLLAAATGVALGLALAPTVTSIMAPGRAPDISAGQNLFAAQGPRHAPILFSSTLLGTPARIGVLSDDANTKLVLHLDAAMPVLLDLTQPDPDGVDLAQSRPLQTSALLSELVRSPIFPRER